MGKDDKNERTSFTVKLEKPRFTFNHRYDKNYKANIS